jgi:hypothetical protein
MGNVNVCRRCEKKFKYDPMVLIFHNAEEIFYCKECYPIVRDFALYKRKELVKNGG